MASSKWKVWDEISSILENKEIVFWGASNWVERTVDMLPMKAKYIVDNNPNNNGVEYFGLRVRSPKVLLEEDRDNLFIIILKAVASSYL